MKHFKHNDIQCHYLDYQIFIYIIQCISLQASNNPDYTGPKMGPKMSGKTEHKEWTEEELRAGRQGTIGLQMGSNKGASQAGISMGKQRMIKD